MPYTHRHHSIFGLSIPVVALFGRAVLANTVMVFNPWDGQVPLQIPVAYVNGLTTGVATTPSPVLCGWYELSVPSMPTTILFHSSGTGSIWGAGGMGSPTTISLSAFGKYDTVWIASVAGAAKVTTIDPGNIGTCQSTQSGTHTILSTGRCDLFSASLSGSTGCLDLSKLSGTTLQVPDAVTRLSTDGLVLCGSGSVGVPGTDIAYVVDQSGSMVAFHTSNLILPHGIDTINFHDCKSWTSPSGVKFPGTLPMVTYKGNSVQELPTSTYDSALVHCTPSGDPYQQRAAVVQSAILKQAQLAPTSYAAWIPFGTKYTSTKLYSLATTASTDSLVNQVILQNLDQTNYTDPIGWARALLQGATSGSQTMPSSPNNRKAIILVSDGSPNDYTSALAEVQPGVKVVSPAGVTWTLPNVKSPPIYGIMLSPDTSQGKDLKNLALATGGAYYWIPTLDRDSLNRVMERLLGLLANTGTPDSLRITNLTNGQVSNSVASGMEGAGFRFRLDSIVGLDTGNNVLEMRDVMHGSAGDSVATIRWTVDVTSSGTNFVPGGADTTLMAACYDPSRLRLRPTTDTTRTYADQRDNSVSTFLDVKLADQYSFPIRFSTSISLDSGLETLGTTPNPVAIRALLGGTNSWVLSLTQPVRNDALVQTGYGWDTLHATFHMPRDHRDSAVALLPVFHPAPVGITLSPDTAVGDTGRFQVVVSDPNSPADTASAVVHHRLGDSLRVRLHRTAPGIYQGSFTFEQNQPVVRGDTVLQLGPARTLQLDSVWGDYLDSRDTALVKKPLASYYLRFSAADGTARDTFSADTVLRARVPVRLQLWSSTGPVTRSGTIRAVATDGRLIFADSTDRVDSLFPLVGGLATVWLRSDLPVSSLHAVFTPDSAWAAASAGPLAWHSPAPDSAVYLDTFGVGGLDAVRVSFRLPWNPANILTLHWPDASTVLDLSQAVPSVSPDSLTVEWRFAAPRSPLTTSWTVATIPGLFSWNAIDVVQSFPVREEIAPVPLRAKLAIGSSVDTLRVWVSEPVKTTTGAEWLRWGRPSRGLAGDAISRVYQDTLSSQILELLVDTSFPATSSDSVRLAVWPQGGVSDAQGNGPGLVARWVPLEIGQGPFKLSVAAWPPMTSYTGWSVPPTEPALTLFVRPQPGSPWLRPDGQPSGVDSSHYSGALIKTTQDLDGGILYLYDNSGVSVASVDLTPVLQALRQGQIKTPLRKDVQIWVAWNGTSSGGKPVPSGVYLARMFGWTTVEGRKVIFNQIYKLGWRIPGGV